MCSPAGWGHGAEDRVQLSRGGALGAPPASAPFKAGTTNNLVVGGGGFSRRITSGRLPLFGGSTISLPPYIHPSPLPLLPLCPTAPYHAVSWYIPSMRTRVPSFGQTFPNKVGPCQNDRSSITRDEGSRRRRELGVYKRDNARPHARHLGLCGRRGGEVRMPRAQTGESLSSRFQ
jgi:hypothetical protein